MKIIIFRHGEKQSKTESLDLEENRMICLTNKGINQIQKLANSLFKNHKDLIGLDYIYTSSLPRAIQSAEIVRKKLKIKEIKPNLLFKELYSFNDYSTPKEKRHEMLENALKNLDYINETGYSYRQKATEVINFFKKEYSNGTEKIIISSHKALIMSIVMTISNKNIEKIEEAGYFILDFDGKSFKIN